MLKMGGVQILRDNPSAILYYHRWNLIPDQV